MAEKKRLQVLFEECFFFVEVVRECAKTQVRHVVLVLEEPEVGPSPTQRTWSAFEFRKRFKELASLGATSHVWRPQDGNIEPVYFAAEVLRTQLYEAFGRRVLG